ncbi:MAG: cation-efflux pump [Bacillota bacterium]|nr:MAG: cation-efflux pump [Bacillota bacterium]
MKEKITDAKQREKYGKIGSVAAILCNVALAAGKIVAGALTGAISVLADGLNNLADCGSGTVALVSFRMAAKPADKEHPFGHQRVEYVASMLVAFLILVVAFELAKESVGKIISPVAAEFSYLALGVLAASVMVKCGMFFFARTLGKRIDSDVLLALSKDSLSDCVATAVVIASLLVAEFTGFNPDGYAGALVALFVALSGVGILKDTMSKLIGQAVAPELIEEIKARIFAHEEVLGVHDISVYSFGPNKFYASVHIELDASVDVMASHELVDEIEQEFARETNVSLTGHLDPIVVNDPAVVELRKKFGDLVRGLDENYCMHDFRTVIGPHRTNVIFEVAVPFDCKKTDGEIKAEICRAVQETDGGVYTPVVHVERQ